MRLAAACLAAAAAVFPQGVSSAGSAASLPLTKASSAPRYPTVDSPLPVQLIERSSDAAHAREREADSDRYNSANLEVQKRTAYAAERQLYVGWAGIGLSAFAAALLGWTLRETRRGARAAQSSAIEAAKAAAAAVRSTELAEQALHSSEPAWLHVEVTGGLIGERVPRPIANEAVPAVTLANVVLKNVGVGPAMITSHTVFFPDNKVTNEPSDAFMPLLPGQQIEFGPITCAIGLNAANRTHWIRNPPALVGRVRYRTRFGQTREFGFSLAQRMMTPVSAWRYVGSTEQNFDHLVDGP
jgi:hypothetical protein